MNDQVPHECPRAMRRRARFPKPLILMMLFVAGVASGGECDQARPEWIWCDDFESDVPITDRYEDVSLNGLSEQGDVSFDGSNALRQTYVTGQVGAGWIIKVMSYPDHLFVRWYHRFGEGYTTYPPKMARVGYRPRSGDWDAVYRVHAWLDSQSSELTADVFAENSSQTSSGWLPVEKSDYFFRDDPDEWVAVEIELKLNDPGSSNGLYRFWVNDRLVIEALGVDLRGNTTDKINEVMFDGYWNGGATANLDRYFDNIVISTKKVGLLGDVGVPKRPKPPADFRSN